MWTLYLVITEKLLKLIASSANFMFISLDCFWLHSVFSKNLVFHFIFFVGAFLFDRMDFIFSVGLFCQPNFSTVWAHETRSTYIPRSSKSKEIAYCEDTICSKISVKILSLLMNLEFYETYFPFFHTFNWMVPNKS